MSSIFRFPHRGQADLAAPIEKQEPGANDLETEDSEAKNAAKAADSEKRLKTSETNGATSNRSRSKAPNGSKRRPRNGSRGRAKKPAHPRERVIVNGTKPLDAPVEDSATIGRPAIPPIEDRPTKKRPVARTQPADTNSAPKSTANGGVPAPASAAERSGSAGSAELNGAASGLQVRVDELEERLERLSVICEAMWELLSGEAGLSLDQLATHVEQRGSASTEAKHQPTPAEPDSICPDCQQTMPVGAKTCLFCSARPSGSTSG